MAGELPNPEEMHQIAKIKKIEERRADKEFIKRVNEARKAMGKDELFPDEKYSISRFIYNRKKEDVLKAIKLAALIGEMACVVEIGHSRKEEDPADEWIDEREAAILLASDLKIAGYNAELEVGSHCEPGLEINRYRPPLPFVPGSGYTELVRLTPSRWYKQYNLNISWGNPSSRK